jgi:hypothetical protein
MARDIGGRPADVAGEKFVEWFGRQTGWTIETRRSYRAGIRGFRWAVAAAGARPPMKLFA